MLFLTVAFPRTEEMSLMGIGRVVSLDQPHQQCRSQLGQFRPLCLSTLKVKELIRWDITVPPSRGLVSKLYVSKIYHISLAA